MNYNKYLNVFMAGMIALLSLTVASCNRNAIDFDASGNFEADEVIVSAEQDGRLLSFIVKEGDSLSKDIIVGRIDVTRLELQKDQVLASISALRQKTADPRPEAALIRKQLAVLKSQLAQQEREKTRTENLIKGSSATQKQLDDINASIDQLSKQIAVTEQQLIVSETNIATQNRSILSEQNPLKKSVAQYNEQIGKGIIINPVRGTVLARYALEGEMTARGKALYKIANIDTLNLRAYITGTQLSEIKLGQAVKVYIDQGPKKYKEYEGVIYWISDKAEFTPKTIQTKEERANLVYAVKIRVKNDGYIKIGMYGEVKWATPQQSK